MYACMHVLYIYTYKHTYERDSGTEKEVKTTDVQTEKQVLAVIEHSCAAAHSDARGIEPVVFR